jgi:hypothetical protein
MLQVHWVFKCEILTNWLIRSDGVLKVHRFNLRCTSKCNCCLFWKSQWKEGNVLWQSLTNFVALLAMLRPIFSSPILSHCLQCVDQLRCQSIDLRNTVYVSILDSRMWDVNRLIGQMVGNTVIAGTKDIYDWLVDILRKWPVRHNYTAKSQVYWISVPS